METIKFMGIDLKGYPKLFLRVNSVLAKMGIKAVKTGDYGYMNTDSCEKELTLYVSPNYDSDVYTSYPLRRDSKINTVLMAKKGFGRGYDYGSYTLPDKLDGEKHLIEVKEDRTNVIIGMYLKDRNIITLCFDMFNTSLALQLDSEYLLYFLTALEEFAKKVEVKTLDTTKFMQENLLKKFNLHISKRLGDINYKIEKERNNVESYQLAMMESTKAMQLARVELVAMSKHSQVTMETLQQQINAIKTLDFVKNVELVEGKICLEIHNVKIRFKGNDVDMGNYRVGYSANKIYIENFEPKKSKDWGTVHHPHIQGDSICFGTRKQKMYDLLASLKLKQLTYFVYLFLKSYNVEDKYCPIELWTGEVEEDEDEQDEEDEDYESDNE